MSANDEEERKHSSISSPSVILGPDQADSSRERAPARPLQDKLWLLLCITDISFPTDTNMTQLLDWPSGPPRNLIRQQHFSKDSFEWQMLVNYDYISYYIYILNT